ncbi:MAG: hypothetical protein R3174_02690, partial [Gammaproteobacteria bacterium]|nr:hypothetical protein [Gammaproteobacteria bacterium]
MKHSEKDRFDAPVRLSFNGSTRDIHSLEEFERTLAPKTLVTTQLFARLSSLSEEKLFALTLSTRRASDRLQAGLKRAVDQGTDAKSLLIELGPSFFTDDHAWRELFTQLVALPPSRNELKLLALTKYHRYLGARLEALNAVACNRIQSKICNHAHSVTEEVTQL